MRTSCLRSTGPKGLAFHENHKICKNLPGKPIGAVRRLFWGSVIVASYMYIHQDMVGAACRQVFCGHFCKDWSSVCDLQAGGSGRNREHLSWGDQVCGAGRGSLSLLHSQRRLGKRHVGIPALTFDELACVQMLRCSACFSEDKLFPLQVCWGPWSANDWRWFPNSRQVWFHRLCQQVRCVSTQGVCTAITLREKSCRHPVYELNSGSGLEQFQRCAPPPRPHQM